MNKTQNWLLSSFRLKFFFSLIITGLSLVILPLTNAQEPFSYDLTIDPSISTVPDLSQIPPLQDLRDDGARFGSGDRNGSDVLPESVLPQNLAEEFAYRFLEENNFGGDAEILLIDPSTGDVYTFSQNNFEQGNEPVFAADNFADFIANGGQNALTIFFQPNETCLCFFYNNLPNIAFGEEKNVIKAYGFHVIRDIADSQTKLNQALTGFKNTALAKNAFVQAGFAHTRRIVLIDNNVGNNVFQGSPSQYNASTNVIYINEDDLNKYGYVVILHELIQAGLTNALSQEYISVKDYQSIEGLGKKYFSRLIGGYINSRDIISLNIDNLTTNKSFAFGLTYKLLKKHYSSLNSGERTKARRFFSDIENNKYLSEFKIRGSAFPGVILLDYHLMGSPGAINQSDIDKFTTAFKTENSAVNKLINPIGEKVSKGLKRQKFLKILPALTVVL